ncbi:faciogenital dysplasia protein [Anaeramoeba ignava]|uniref:Faciogenital dysplasia protein n=1 Tax=Anaeramoeba ignava TaxID=1746090 RepID=A0A9Q0LS51_ANAIG|nr:faciogenital dysplasia protein [Anaeramoeba ignava]
MIEQEKEQNLNEINQENPKSINGFTSMRHQVANEIFTTEDVYIKKLTILANEFSNELINFAKNDRSFISEKDIKAIFDSIKSILEVNFQLYSELAICMNPWNDEAKIGKAFLQFIPFLKIYRNYIENYDNTTKTLEKFAKTPKFSSWAQEKKMEHNLLDLPSFLIMPVQRLPRYQLLLKELVSNTDQSHCDYTDLVKAQEEITKVNNFVNESIHKRENDAKILAIQKKFSNKALKDLVAPHRKYIYDSPLHKLYGTKKIKLHFFLFNDIIIYGTESSGSYTLYRIMKINFCSIEEGDPQQLQFFIQNMDKKYTIFAESKEEKRKLD